MRSKQPFGDIAGINAVDLTVRPSSKSKGKVRAWCTSNSCNSTGTSIGKEKKHAKKTDTYCPDCGHALFWGRGIE